MKKQNETEDAAGRTDGQSEESFSRLTRRRFLRGAGLTAIGATVLQHGLIDAPEAAAQTVGRNGARSVPLPCRSFFALTAKRAV